MKPTTLRATSHTRLKAHDHGNAIAQIVQVHFTLGGAGLKDQRKVCGRKIYMESYMAGWG